MEIPNFSECKVLRIPGLALRDTLQDALRDPLPPFFTGCLLVSTCETSLPDAVSKGESLEKRRFV